MRRPLTTYQRMRVQDMSTQMQEVMNAELEQAIALLNEANKLMESLFSTKEAE